MPRDSDSGFTPLPSTPLPSSTQQAVADLQTELIRTLRRDIREFNEGSIDRCLMNAERVLGLRRAIRALDKQASLYWSIRPSGTEP